MAAKKSNKTEHVLKLITKNDDASREDDYFGISAEPPQEDPIPKTVQQVQVPEPVQQEVQVPEPVQQEEQVPEPAQVEQKEETAAPVQEEEPEPEQQPKEPPTVRAFREQERAGTTVIIAPGQNDELVNIAEILAREKLALVMERMKVCTCRTCVNDVLALALNSLPTKYVTTDAGKQYFQLDVYKKQYETDILAALTKACVRVKASPRH
jgi:competence protein ComFB